MEAQHPLKVPEPMSQAQRDYFYIRNTIIPELMDKIANDFEHYGDTYQTLGTKGQFADIWRKVGPLKRAMWDDAEHMRETPREICMDLIGHCLLTIMMYDAPMRQVH